jgi:hypothetical protein
LAKSLEELRDGFADLWASLGNVSFDLTWHNLSGCVTPPFDQDAREVIGNLALPFTWPPDESEFTLGCDVLTLPKDEKFTEARSTFKDLSSEAGRRLPAIGPGLQSYVGQLNDDPAAWWYAMLFQGHKEHVAYQQGNETEYHKSLSIWQPVKDSVQAIGVLIEREPPSGETKTEIKGGYLGGKELMEALEIHPTQKNAFEKSLERMRGINFTPDTKQNRLADKDWIEVRDPPANSPRYFYNVSSHELQERVKRYQSAKST